MYIYLKKMKAHLHLLTIGILGISNFHFASAVIKIDNLELFNNSSGHFTEKSRDYSTLKALCFITANRIGSEIKKEISKPPIIAQNELQENKMQIQEATVDPLEALKKITQLKIVIAVCLFLLLIISSFLVVARIKNGKTKYRLKTKLDLQEKEVKRLEDELYKINKDLTDFALDIARKNEFTQEIGFQLNQLKKTTSIAARETLLQELIFKTHHHLKTNDDFERFQQNIKKVNHAFFEKVSTQFNKLTSNEIHLCGLIRLGLTIKDIASIKNISPKSVEMNRYRLRKKLALEEGKDLYQFLNTI